MRLHNFLAIIGLFLIIIALPQPFSAAGETQEVATTDLLVRAEPSGDGKVLGKLNIGDKLTVFKESHGWSQTYYNGKKAWVASHYLTSSQTKTKPKQKATYTSNSLTEQAKITANGTRLRKGPSTNDSIRTTIPYGTAIQITATEGDWHQVTTSDGSVGWVASSLTDHPTESQKTKANEKIASTTTSSEEETTSDKQIVTKENGSLAGYHIVLDAGHGGKDPGALSINHTYEKDLTLQTTNAIASELRNAGANVTLTRTGDYYISLSQRVGISNADQADAFISVHYNSFPTQNINGFSTHYYDGSTYSLAQSVQKNLGQQLPLNSRGSKQDDYHVLRNNKHPSLLLELGFLTNFHDVNTIQSSGFQSKVGLGVKNGLIEHFAN